MTVSTHSHLNVHARRRRRRRGDLWRFVRRLLSSTLSFLIPPPHSPPGGGEELFTKARVNAAEVQRKMLTRQILLIYFSLCLSFLWNFSQRKLDDFHFGSMPHANLPRIPPRCHGTPATASLPSSKSPSPDVNGISTGDMEKKNHHSSSSSFVTIKATHVFAAFRFIPPDP